MTFGQKLTIARKQKGWTQGELGDMVNVASGLIGKYERGEVNPPLEVACRIAQVLDCSLDYLAGNAEENKRKVRDSIPSQLIPLINKLMKLSAGNRAVIASVVDAFIAKEKL